VAEGQDRTGLAAFTDQLTAPGHVLDLRVPGRRPPFRDFPGRAAPGRAVPGVLLLTRAHDGEADAVRRLLHAAGIPTARVDADELATAELLVRPGDGTVRLNGAWLAPTVTWSRHFSVQAIARAGDQVRDRFLRESWQAAAGQLAAISRFEIGSHRPGLGQQLLAARRLRVAVPRTVLTTDLFLAKGAFPDGNLVVKAAGGHFVEAAPGRLSGIFPVITDREALAACPSPGAPVIVQEYVEHEAELRVYYADGRVHGFEIGKEGPSAPWTDAEGVSVSYATPPPPVVAATEALAAAMSLRYGAFDFLIRAGEPVFLEVNADGDWLWAERKARVGTVTVAVARMLAVLHWQARRALPSGGPGPGPFDLLAFLRAG
jgi:hypothetical protein